MRVKVGIVIVAVLHLGFAFAEIFRWEDVIALLLGLKEATDTTAIKLLLLNQGAYNAFFAIGLLAALSGLVPAVQRKALVVFCLASLAAAGLVGLATVQHLFFLIQLVPAAGVLAYILFKPEEV